jgi:5-deoxy-glucuronate isomerase
VFEGVSDFAYVPRDRTLTLRSDAGALVALPMARAESPREPVYVAAADVPVETRGAGRATRQLNNFLSPEAGFAERLTAVEVLTPPGSWSSYPAHKHDEQTATEAELEEIYYFRMDGTDSAWGLHRTYDLREGWDVTATVRTDDVFLVPRGYHGPCAAPPDYAMYYLNVLAGPAPEPSLAFSDDPSQAYIRATWDGMPTDERIPMTQAQE